MDIELTKETEANLAAVAALKEMQPEALAAQMLEEQVRRLALFERERTEDMDRLENMKNSGGVAHDDMMNWLEGLSTGKNI